MSEQQDQVSAKFELKNRLGLHARPASMFVETASTFTAEIKVLKDGETVNGKSLMGLLMLSAGFGSEVEVIAEGPDAQTALDKIADLFERKFDEE